jgi:hypothetical protein
MQFTDMFNVLICTVNGLQFQQSQENQKFMIARTFTVLINLNNG